MMKRIQKYVAVLGITIAFAIIIAALLNIKRSSEELFSVVIRYEDGEETVSSWENDKGEIYIFLPSGVKLEDIQLVKQTQIEILIDGQSLGNRMPVNTFAKNTPFELTYNSFGKTEHKTLIFVQSANIPAMYIDTQTGSMDYIREEKGNKESGNMRLYTADGALNVEEKLVSLYGRGNQTWSDFDKKPYGFVLENESDLLGLGSAQNWVLFANASDTSHMRNKIAYSFAEQVGMAYSPDSEWVDLYLNGEYAGLYLLCERNEIHPERINLTDTDSYLVSMQIESRLIKQNYPYVRTETGQSLRIHNPNEPTAATIADIAQIFQSVENSLMDENEVDHTSGKSWRELIDVDSWAKMFLIDEVFMNIDACYTSLYFYVDGLESTQKVYAGPVWDYDHSMGSAHIWHIANPNAMYANRLHTNAGFDTPWFHRLYQNEYFYTYMVELYEAEFLPALQTLLNNMDVYAKKIECAVYMNNVRWSTEDSDVYEEVAYIQNFIVDHVTFLSDIWLNQTDYRKVTLAYGDWGFYGYFYVRTGETLDYVPELKNTEYSIFGGWYYSDTDKLFDITQPITEDIEIYAKWEETSNKKFEQVAKLMPLAVIAILGVLLLFKDVYHNKKAR